MSAGDDPDDFATSNHRSGGLYVGIGEVYFSLTLPRGSMSGQFIETFARRHPPPPPSDEFEPSAAERKWAAEADAAYMAAARSDLAAATGHDGWRTSGPYSFFGHAAGVPPGDVVDFVLQQTPQIERIVTWITALGFLAKGMMYLRDRFGEDPVVNDGSAAIVASRAIFEKSGDRDLTFAFSVGLNPRTQADYELEMPDGFLVGFRGGDKLWTAVVALNGDVLAVESQPVADELPTWWRDRRRHKRTRQ